MKKSLVVTLLCVILAAVLTYCVMTGLCERMDVLLNGFSVSKDGTKMTITVDIASSAGYTRGFKDNGGGVKPHYLTFYSTFGGINSRFGAKNTFEIELSETDSEIFFKREQGGYELVLQKNEHSGKWERPINN